MLKQSMFSVLTSFSIGVAGVIAGAAASGERSPQDASGADAAAPALEPMMLMRSSQAPLGVRRARAEGEKPDTAVVDSYIDWDTGALTLLSDRGSVAMMPLPANWRFCHAIVDGGLVSIAYEPGTGAAYYLSADGLNWVAIAEPTDRLTVGSYGVYLASVSDSMYAMRYDEYSGRSWILDGEEWRPIEGNLPPSAPAEESK